MSEIQELAGEDPMTECHSNELAEQYRLRERHSFDLAEQLHLSDLVGQEYKMLAVVSLRRGKKVAPSVVASQKMHWGMLEGHQATRPEEEIGLAQRLMVSISCEREVLEDLTFEEQ